MRARIGARIWKQKMGTHMEQKTENKNCLNLEPCPFCGGKAFLYVNDGVCVRCGNCKAQTRVLIDGWGVHGAAGNATLAVIEAWNKRT